jgi:hypothetical protein
MFFDSKNIKPSKVAVGIFSSFRRGNKKRKGESVVDIFVLIICLAY